jgi:ketosteroid isomerase-like protein
MQGEVDMAEHPNAELVRRGFEAFATGDMATLNELMSDDAAWHTSGRGPLAGDFRGKEAIFGSFARIPQETDTFSQQIHALLADDEHAVALVEATATRKGRTAAMQQVFVFHVSGGKATEVWVTAVDPYAADEFWA